MTRGVVRIVALAGITVALLIAPTVWAFDTLGHASSPTFPAGGPADVAAGDGFAGPAAFPGALRAGRLRLGGSATQLLGAGAGGPTQPAGGFPGGAPGGFGAPPGAPGGSARAGGFPGARPGGAFGADVSTGVLRYVAAHGGGTIAVSSQSSAAQAILAWSHRCRRNRRILGTRERRERRVARSGGRRWESQLGAGRSERHRDRARRARRHAHGRSPGAHGGRQRVREGHRRGRHAIGGERPV